MRIDTHHHFWNYSLAEYGWISEEMATLRRDFLPDELRNVISESKIDRVISVQARQTLLETRWLIEFAQHYSWIAGVVGWVPLASDRLRDELDRLTSNRELKGVRHVVQDEPDDRFILGAAFNRGIGILKEFKLAYDILIYAKHLPATIEFVDQHPDQMFILDHIAKPTIDSRRFDEVWAVNLRELGRRKNVACKFSGVATEVRDKTWNDALIRPYWDVALESFGIDRLMFGSDWPVCLLKTDYPRWLKTVESLTVDLSADEQKNFWSGNAIKFYRL